MVLLLAVFHERTSLGVVRHFFGAFAQTLAALNAEETAPAPITGDFERELGRNLAMLFGRA